MTVNNSRPQWRRLADMLKQRRLALGLSASEVARRAGIDKHTYINLENAERGRPAMESVQVIADALAIPIADVFAITGWLPRTELPSFRPYLRTKYNHMPEAALKDMEAYFDDIASRYQVSDGPKIKKTRPESTRTIRREGIMTTSSEPGGTLSALRALIPDRAVSVTEAIRVAEQQAGRLLRRFGVTNWPVPDDIMQRLPRITVDYVWRVPSSGCSFWDNRSKSWIVELNASEPATRQRFTMWHEYKHIVDHGHAAVLYGHGPGADDRAELTADYFAGCLLVPRTLLKRAWGRGLQTSRELAAAFDVSTQAIDVRLAQIGLLDNPARCDRFGHLSQSGQSGSFLTRTRGAYS